MDSPFSFPSNPSMYMYACFSDNSKNMREKRMPPKSISGEKRQDLRRWTRESFNIIHTFVQNHFLYFSNFPRTFEPFCKWDFLMSVQRPMEKKHKTWYTTTAFTSTRFRQFFSGHSFEVIKFTLFYPSRGILIHFSVAQGKEKSRPCLGNRSHPREFMSTFFPHMIPLANSLTHSLTHPTGRTK